MYVHLIDRHNGLRHINWEREYTLLRQTVGAVFPGYMIHEAVRWLPGACCCLESRLLRVW